MFDAARALLLKPSSSRRVFDGPVFATSSREHEEANMNDHRIPPDGTAPLPLRTSTTGGPTSVRGACLPIDLTWMDPRRRGRYCGGADAT